MVYLDDDDRGRYPWDDRFYDNPPQPPPQTGLTPPVPPPGEETSPVGGETGPGDISAFSYSMPTFGGSFEPQYAFSKVPGFTAPEFNYPSVEDMMAEPGYQFRLEQGTDALQNAAAARGVLRTGGTLKGLIDYGQNYAASEYSNVFERALQAYDRRYQGARDEYAPNLIEWQTLMSGMQRQKDLAWQREWDAYTFGLDDEFRREDMLYGGGSSSL